MIEWLRKRTDERRAIKMSKVLTYLNLHPGLHGALELAHAVGYRSGVLYPTLRRLEEKKLITTKWVDQPEGRPPRRFYQAAP